MSLPIKACLDDIRQALQQHARLVIQAPPGAGKTTLVPLALLQEQRLDEQFLGRILVIQPRRLAVVGAAYRMASLLGEAPGATIAYTTRYERKQSPGSRVEVMTEGIFLRAIQQDPELTGVSVIIFDEFHERSVNNDLALAFALESQQALRSEDSPLKVIVMSATLDGEPLASWLEAPLVRSEGRTFPVETFYRPLAQGERMESHIARLTLQALKDHEGSALVFLPGMKEIRRVLDLLQQSPLPDRCQVYPLHAALPHEQQQQAIIPSDPGQRKIVLTTNVAETSVTIEGIRIVIDSGLERVARFDERKAMNVLSTEKISLASAEQRRGRAGRMEPGVCYRAWGESEQQQRKKFSDPEITHTDLLPVALELAIWGCQNIRDLQLLTVPDAASLQRARETLLDMDAIRSNGLMTPAGERMAKLGLHPHLAKLLLVSEAHQLQSAAIAVAAILSEGDPLRFAKQFTQSDLSLRLQLWQSTRSIGDLHRGTWERIRKLSQQLTKRMQCSWQPDNLDHNDIALCLAQAFPDRVAQLRAQTQHRYLLANGKGVQLNPEDNLAGAPYLIVLDATGSGSEPFIQLAMPLSWPQFEAALGSHFQRQQVISWNTRKQAVESVAQMNFHHLILEKKPMAAKDPEAVSQCLLQGIRTHCGGRLPWNEADQSLLMRMNWLHVQSPDTWPDWREQTLLAQAEDWLLPYLAGMNRYQDLQQLNLGSLLLATLPPEKQRQLEQQAPKAWLLPTGSLRDIQYDSEKGPVLSARMQELYGLTTHPCIGSGYPLLIEILSPASRPIQITRDLPAFWQGSYREVAKEMRGRYPKHVWPDDPANARATTKTKRHQ